MSNETPAEVLAEIAERYSGDAHLMHYHARLSHSLAAGKVATPWTDEQCIEFACVAFRHAQKNLPKGVTLDDIRLGAIRVGPMIAPPADPAKASAPEYDRSLIADMLESANGPRDSTYCHDAIVEQIRLLRAADNADAAKVRTVRRASGSAPDDLALIVDALEQSDPKAAAYPEARSRHTRALEVARRLLATPPASAPEVTEEMVKRAAKAMAERNEPPENAWRFMCHTQRQAYLNDARAALTAALQHGGQ